MFASMDRADGEMSNVGGYPMYRSTSWYIEATIQNKRQLTGAEQLCATGIFKSLFDSVRNMD